MDSKRGWEHAFEILVHVDRISHQKHTIMVHSTKPEWSNQNGYLLVLKRSRLLTRSSITSFTAATTRMKSNGTSVVHRPVGETSGICWNTQAYTLMLLAPAHPSGKPRTSNLSKFNSHKITPEIGVNFWCSATQWWIKVCVLHDALLSSKLDGRTCFSLSSVCEP